jgi:hypothetical protein
MLDEGASHSPRSHRQWCPALYFICLRYRSSHARTSLQFDISPDGRDVVFERVQERSDVVLLHLPLR